MNSSFYIGVGGAKAQQFGLDVWGNNISNINTVGFRSSTPEFATLISQYKSGIALGGADETGLGVSAQTTALSMLQGSVQTTDRVLDLAIEGNGWFGVQRPGDTNTYYTRAGDFYTDADSNVLNGSGSFLLGTYTGNMTINKDGTATVSAAGGTSSDILKDPNSQEPLKFPKNITHPGLPATEAVMGAIPSYDVELQNGAATISYALPKQTTPYISITDASGNVVKNIHQSTQGAGQHHVVWDGKDEDGNTVADGSYTVNITYVDTPAKPAVAVGSLKDYMIDSNGMVIASFDNGQNSIIAQIPLYHFQNEQGLEKLGDNEFRSTDNSGEAIFYKQPSTGKNVAYKNDLGTSFYTTTDAAGVIQGGKIRSKALEMSNVSAAEAMTNLIITERAYSANAKVITTSDQIIQRAISLKRG